MVINIGREEGKEKARLSVSCSGKTLFAGNPGCVPKSVSREHLRIILSDENETVTLENTSENNLVYVDGMDVRRFSGVSRAARVELGPDRFPVDLNALVRLFPQTLKIGHLKEVEERYRKARREYQIRQARFNALSTITPILTMGSIAAGIFIKDENLAALRAAMYILAVLLAVFFFVFRWINSKRGPEWLEQLEEDYRK